MLRPNSPAPAFSLPSTSGKTVSTKDLRGRRFVLYFYPQDDTPGCTREACGFRDNMARLGTAKAAVFGVSKDGIASHQKFKAKYGLPFELLSDEGNVVARKYGAFGQKMMYGKAVTGVIRSTFLIDAEGKIERMWSPVKVDGHVDAVLEAVLEAVPGAQAAAPAATSSAKKTRVAKGAGTIAGARAKSAKKKTVRSATKSGSSRARPATAGKSKSKTGPKTKSKKA